MSKSADISIQIFAGCLISLSTLTWAKETINISQTESLRHSSNNNPNTHTLTTKLRASHKVEVGQICGKKNNAGAELVCRSNARCVLTVNGDHGMCVASSSLIQAQ
ncbi:MAG: hypothetical protein COB61_005605 [Thiotrichales bacterium]|nr:hypothetical protein [Thiotrichales bacterium]